MDKHVTVSVKGLLVTGLVLLGLAVAYLLGGAGDGGVAAVASPLAAPPAETPAKPRTLTMTGTGEAGAVPDQVTFDLSVGVTRPDLDTALKDASRTMRRLLGVLEEYGVKRGDVQTAGLSMNPVYDYYSYSPPVLRGYKVTQRSAVLVKDLKEAGGAVAAVVESGGDAVRVSDIRLQIGDPEAALAKARKAAVAQASAKAQEYADATGQELGEVLTLREVDATSQSAITRQTGLAELAMGYKNARGARDSVVAALPIRTGRADLQVEVEVVWQFA